MASVVYTIEKAIGMREYSLDKAVEMEDRGCYRLVELALRQAEQWDKVVREIKKSGKNALPFNSW